MILKNHDGFYFFKILKRLLLDGLAGMLFISQGHIKHTLEIIKAHFSFYKSFIRMLKKRKIIKKQTTEFNQKGIYKGNILWAKYVKKINCFSSLNHRLFTDY